MPAGMTVYFQTPTKVFGHVACSLGDGSVISQNSVNIGDSAINRLTGTLKVEFDKMANAVTHIVPIRDMLTELRADWNAQTLAEADLLTWQIPPDVTVVADDVFWFTLHGDRRFIGWEGVTRYALMHDLAPIDALDALGVEVLICFEADDARCALARSDRFEPPREFIITRGRSLVYIRKAGA